MKTSTESMRHSARIPVSERGSKIVAFRRLHHSQCYIHLLTWQDTRLLSYVLWAPKLSSSRDTSTRWCGYSNTRELISARCSFLRTLGYRLGFMFPHKIALCLWLCSRTEFFDLLFHRLRLAGHVGAATRQVPWLQLCVWLSSVLGLSVVDSIGSVCCRCHRWQASCHRRTT
jgi:hypothetical protein